MMLIRRAATAALVLAITAAGCSGNGASAPQPLGVAQPSSGAATLGAATNPTQSLPSGGDAGLVTYPNGSGSVSATDSTNPPTGTTALTASARAAASGTVKTQADSNVPLLYLSYTAQTAATLNGVPGVSVTLSAPPPTNSVYQAVWNGTAWVTVGGPASINGSVVTFGVVAKGTYTLAAGSALNVAIYSGATIAGPTATPTASPTASPTPSATPTHTPSPSPSPTPTITPVPTSTPVGATPTPTPTPSPTPNAVRDPGFESDTVGNFGTAINSTGWTQCTNPVQNFPTGMTPQNAGPGSSLTATPHPVSSYTPAPGTTPGAEIGTNGMSLPQPTATMPAPSQSTFISNSGNYGGLFGTFPATPTNYATTDYHYDGLCQTVTIPSGTSNFSFYVFGNGNNGPTKIAFEAILLNADNTWNSWLYDESVDNDTAYHPVSFAMPPSTAGNTYTLFVGIWSNSSGSVYTSGYYFLDDLALVPTVAGTSIKRAPMTAHAVRKK